MTDYDKLAEETFGAPLPNPTEQKYDSILDGQLQDRHTQLRTALKRAADSNPDALAKRQRLSQETGLAPGVIEADEPAVAAEAYVRRYEKLLETNKPLADWLSNPDNAASAKDEVDLLDGVVKAATGVADNVRSFVGDPLKVVVGGTLSGAGTLIDTGARALDRGYRTVFGDRAADALWFEAPWWVNPTEVLRRPGEQIEKFAEETVKPPEERRGIDTDISGALGQVTAQITMAILSGGASAAVSTGSLLAQGADQQYDRAQAAGAGQAEQDTAVLAGAGITAITERYGLDKLLNRVPPAIKNRLLRQLADVALAGGQEAAQEVVEGVLQNLTAVALYDPQAPVLEGLERDAVVAGTSGSIARIVLNAVLPGRQAHQAHDAAKRAEAITGALAEAQVLKRNPEQVAALVQAAAEKGGMGQLWLPADVWTSYFQSAGLDPAGEYERITGDRGEYFEAVGTGSMLPLDAADYFTKLDAAAQQKFNKEFKTAPEAMSETEAEEFDQRRDELVAGIADIVGEGTASEDTSAGVYNDVLGQLLGSGLERGAAETQAALYQSFFRTMAARAGQDPLALYQQYGLQVGRELPEALRRRAIDTNLDPLIDRLRAGNVPTEAQTRGQSLVEFLRERGLRDDQGDLATMDPDKELRPFQRRLLREDGMALDMAARAAQVAGYFNAEDPNAPDVMDSNTLLEAVDAELRGERRYADRNLDQQAEDLRQVLLQLDEFLGRAGLDVRTVSNDDIKRFLTTGEMPEAQEAPVQTLDQSKAPDSERRPMTRDEILDSLVRDRKIPAPPEGAKLKPDEWLDSVLGLKRGTFFQPAYHGTPHEIGPEGFKLDKIGTGEGAQAYGWGLYFAENPAVAAGYKKAVTTKKFLDKIRDEYDGHDSPRDAEDAIVNSGAFTEPERALLRALKEDDWFGFDYPHQAVHMALTQIDNYDPSQATRDALGKMGAVYQVDIADEAVAKMLDWDAPLAQQPESVRKALTFTVEKETEPSDSKWLLKVNGRNVNGYQTRKEALWSLENSTLGQIYDTLTISSGPANVSRWLNSLGIPGIRYKDEGSRRRPEWEVVFPGRSISMPTEEMAREAAAKHAPDYDVPAQIIHHAPTRNLVVFDESIVKITHKDGSPVTAAERKEFLQRDPENQPRGRIDISKDRRFRITLMEKADLSTFLHESGHFFLEVMGDLAERPGAPEVIRQDYAEVLKWLGVESRAQIKTEHHEQWARGFEAYLFEGKAPTAELRTAFARFRSWLVAVYRQLVKLTVTLTPEVRRVMDRLVATEQEIAAASEQMNYDALPPEVLQMDAEAQAAYQRGVAEARAKAEEELTTDALDEIQREQRKWWRDRRAEVKREVEAAVNGRPVYGAQHYLRTGKRLDGEPLPEGVTPQKLARKPLVDAYGEDFVKTRMRGLYVKSGGVHPDVVAGMFGFDSGDAMVQALVNAPDRQTVIEQQTDAAMRERYGDILTDGTLPERAMAAVHNDKRGALLLNELLHLQKRLGLRHTTTLQQMKAAARSVIARKKVRDISPNRYRVAEAKAARMAYDAAVSGDIDTAAKEKRKQIINHELYRAALEAREEVDKITDYMHGFGKRATRERIGKGGKAYLEQIDAILERYGFRQGRVAQEKVTALAEFLGALDKAGEEVGIDSRVLNEARRQEYRDVPMEELRGVRDAVKQLEHISRRQRKFKAGQVEAEWEDVKSQLTGAILQNTDAGKPLPADPNAMKWLDKAGQKMGELAALPLKMETVVEWLDGGRHDGPWHRFFFDLATDAQTRENDLTLEYTKKIADIIEDLPKDQRRKMNELVAVPEIGESFTRRGLIAMALNTGNEGNYGKLLRGRNWTDEQVQAALANLTQDEWKFVQKIWRAIDGLWPEIADLQQRLSGLAPEKVEARKVQTPFGEIEGGYYPLVYDRRDSEVGEKQAADAAESMIAGGPYTRATTPRGHTKARIENFAAPILLDLEVLPSHLSKVIKDLTFRETVMQLNKVITDPDIRKGIQTALGLPVADIFRPWVQRIANDRAYGTVQGLGPLERAIRGLRMNTTVVAMGFKATTFFSQFSGFSDAMERVKPSYLARAVARYGRHPLKSTEFVFSLSGEMRHRSNNFERDARDLLKRGLGQSTLQAQAHRFMLYGISFADRQVTVPTWMAAYEQARDAGDGHDAAIRFADKVVRTTQGSGAPKDLSNIQGNSELARAFTMFYSWLSAKYNRMRALARDTGSAVREKRVKDFPALAARAWFAMVVPAILGELLAGRGPDDDEEPAAWALRKVLLFPFMTVPLLRDIIGAAEKGFSYELSPLGGFGKAATRFVAEMKKFAVEDGEAADLGADAVELGGYVVGLPTAQAKITGGYLWDVLQGDESPEDPVDFATGLLFKRDDE